MNTAQMFTASNCKRRVKGSEPAEPTTRQLPRSLQRVFYPQLSPADQAALDHLRARMESDHALGGTS